MEDVLTIGRQAREKLYDLSPEPKDAPVPLSLCFGVEGSRVENGACLNPISADAITELAQELKQHEPSAIAINLLFSYINNTDELKLKSALQNLLADEPVFISCSSEVLATQGEYERGMATWLNAWLGPVVETYLRNLRLSLGETSLSVMQSSGGMIDAEPASQQAVRLLLSGPAGGLAAAKACGEKAGKTKLLTFDMGGTSSDVALIYNDIRLTTEGKIAGYPVAVPMVDMHTIGAGGGSIAWIDAGGAIKVGPESAGANPGPACYGLGGLLPTVTDANAVLGKLQARSLASGNLKFDLAAAHLAFEPLSRKLGLSVEAVAEGVLKITNENMRQALQLISVQKGYDPRDFALCCFGGAGGLHVCALADSMGMKEILVPRFGGVFSALGMLLAPKERQLSKTVNVLQSDIEEADIERVFRALETTGKGQLTREGIKQNTIKFKRSLDARYQGQTFTLNIPWRSVKDTQADFNRAHKLRYGHVLAEKIEIVELRAAAFSPSEILNLTSNKTCESENPGPEYHATIFGINSPVPVYQRESLPLDWRASGPLVLAEQTATTFVESDWHVEIDEHGNILMRRI